MHAAEYTREDTYITKGIAILCMLFHHVIPNICYRPFFLLEDHSFLTLLAASCKVAVFLLTILSGFGLAEVFRFHHDKTVKGALKFTVSRFLQLFAIYWPANLLIGLYTFFRELFTGQLANVHPLHVVLEITGIRRFVGDWFLLAIIILYAAFPLLYRFVDRYRLRAVAITFIPWILYFVRLFTGFLLLPFDHALFYVSIFCLGIYLSVEGKLKRKEADRKTKCRAVMLLIFCLLIRQVITLPADAFVALAILNVQTVTGYGSGAISKVLRIFGKESPNIWLLQYAVLDLIAEIPVISHLHLLIRFVILCPACLLVSVLLSELKKVTGFDAVIRKLRGKLA